MIRPNRNVTTRDKYKKYQCKDLDVLVERVDAIFRDIAAVANVPRDILVPDWERAIRTTLAGVCSPLRIARSIRLSTSS